MIDFLVEPYRNASWISVVIEIVVFVFGIWSIWLGKKVHIAVFPVGLVATILTAYLLFKAELLAEMALNIYFSFMGLYGWYRWVKNQDGAELPISRTTTFQKISGFGFFILTILVTLAIYRIFAIPVAWVNWIDIILSGIFFTAMWFMALKKIENWVLYIVADAVAAPLYAWKGLGLLAIQYLLFTVLAIMAYLEWRKQLQIQNRK